MVSFILEHSRKKFVRSVSFSKDTTTMVFTGILGLVMMAYTVALGFGLELIIVKGLKQNDSVTFLNGLLFYYLGFEFVMRYMMQNLPVLDIQPYLHLPVKRSKLVHYLLGRSFLHLMNFIPLFLFTPFAFMAVASAHSAGVACVWILTLWFCSLSLHLLVVLFKKKLDDNIWGLVTLISFFSFFAAADYFQWFKLSTVSALTFGLIFQYPFLVFIPLLLVIILYQINFRFFLSAIYPEEITTSKANSFAKTGDWTFLRNFGMIGELMNVEVKLILRNKRPKNILYLSGLLLFYGLIFYGKEQYTSQSGFLLFVGIFVTGIFMINYGQLLFSWQGSHQDFTLTRPVSMRQYVESKYWLLSLVTLACFVLTIPYVYFGWNFLLMHLATALFNIGINVFVILNLAMWDPKKVDMKKGVTFNYEGVGAAQWIMAFPILAGPYVFYLPFSIAGYPGLGIAAVGFAGVLGIALREQLLALTTKRLLARKYSMAQGFRKD
jgi:hypothetical protein